VPAKVGRPVISSFSSTSSGDVLLDLTAVVEQALRVFFGGGGVPHLLLLQLLSPVYQCANPIQTSRRESD